MTAQATKQSIRQRIIFLRQQMAEEERARLSQAIAARIAGMDAYRTANTVLAYMNFGAEFAAEIFVRQALRDGKRLLLPRVNRHTNQLDLYWVDDIENQLAAGSWEISEPVVERCERLGALNEIEFILLPGVAFSRDGARLGYGGGYYDKLLARLDSEGGIAHCPALVAGAYSMQFVEGIPQEITDRKVGWLVTESETIDCSM